MKTVQALFSPLLCVLALQFPVAAHAGAKGKEAISKFHQTCDATLAKKDTGDFSLGDCQKGQIAEKVHKNQEAAAIIYGVATGVATALTIIENLHTPMTEAAAQAAKIACISMDVAAVGKQFLDSSTLKKAGSDVVGSYATTVNSFVKTGAMGMGGMALKGLLFDGKSLSSALKLTGNVKVGGKTIKNKTGCLFTAIGLGVMTTASISASTNARQALESSTASAKIQIDAGAKTTSYALKNNQPGAPNNNPGAPNNDPASEFSCDDKSGTAFAQCVGKQNPEIAALVNNPQAMDSLNKALGQNLGDFAKNYNGDSEQDMANYIGQGLGMTGESMAGILGANKKLAKDLGIQEAYKPGAFTAANGGPTGAKGGVDPMEKMLAEMMKQMADPGEDGLGKDRNPASEISFNNQMELLAPDQIAQRKDISLFDRAHYRMQKNLKNLEQLNWSIRDSAP